MDTNNDPSATYRGFRRQALYALYRVFDDTLPNGFSVTPEGEEDLAIRDATGDLIEVVQVKDYSSDLAVSTMKPGWYARIAPYCIPGSLIKVKIISFGQIGRELASAVDNSQETPKRSLETLTKDRTKTLKTRDGKIRYETITGLPLSTAEQIFSHLTITQVNEESLTAAIIEKLRETVTAGDPIQAFHNLMWWLAAAIAGHTEAVNVPTLIYIDVRPGDSHWIEIVRELARHPDIRLLVSIREEDFRTANIGPADFSFRPLALDFSESEAVGIYDAITKRKSVGRFFDFSDAWAQFGSRKTLYEFTYFLTQDGVIADRISRQVAALTDRANKGELSRGTLDLLRLVSVASMFEARLDIAKLAMVCDVPDLSRAINLFDSEYLLRKTNDGRYVEGFHAIRSSIVADELVDTVTLPWASYAVQCLMTATTFVRNSINAAKYSSHV